MSAKGLADVLPFIFPDKDGLVMVISAYFDESERPDGDEPICVGGYLFKPDGYKKFHRKWYRDALCGGRLKHFHSTDLCAGNGVYKGLSISERVKVLDGAVDAISKHSYGGIGVYFDKLEFERVAPPEWPHFRGSIYSTACNMCLQGTASWLRKWRCSHEVLYVFERGHDFKDEADRVLTAIGADPDARKEFQYRNHIFEDKSEYGLQAADLFAWSITKAKAANGNPPRALRPFVPAILRLASANKGRQKVHPFTGQKLVDFLVDQIQGGRGMLSVDFGPKKRAFK